MTEDRVSKLIYFDGKEMPKPAKYDWNIMDVSSSESGRTQDATMHVNRIARKRKIELSWVGLSPEDTSLVLKASAPEYIKITFWDMEENCYLTREFYTGDKAASVKIWHTYRKVIESISFNVIER